MSWLSLGPPKSEPIASIVSSICLLSGMRWEQSPLRLRIYIRAVETVTRVMVPLWEHPLFQRFVAPVVNPLLDRLVATNPANEGKGAAVSDGEPSWTWDGKPMPPPWDATELMVPYCGEPGCLEKPRKTGVLCQRHWEADERRR